MFQIFIREKVATMGMLICFCLSILLRLLLAFLYQRMIRETDNMATTNNRLLKQCKLKFSNCFQLNNGVPNVQVFVEKFMNKFSLGPFSFRALYHISGQLMLLSIVFSGAGVARSIIAGSMFGEILPFYISSLLGLYLYFSLSTLLDIKGKRKALKINLIDYLENHLSYRMQMTRADMQMLYGTNLRELPRSVDIMPIAGWLADREEEEQFADWQEREEVKEAVQWKEREGAREKVNAHRITGTDRQGSSQMEVSDKYESSRESILPPLAPEESEELEMLLKEILTLS